MSGIGNRQLERIQVGARIRAEWLNATVDQVNQNTAVIRPPRQRNAPRANPASDPRSREKSELQDGDAAEQVDAPSLSAETWGELERETSTVRIFQDGDTSSDNYVDVERVESITFLVPTEDGSKRVRLVLKNT